jgi:hypothetical protein
VLIQAAGLALLASLSPTALLVAAVYLGSARPRLTAVIYLTGAVVMSLVMGIALLVILRSANLSRPADYTPRYGLRLGLGILLLVAAAVVARRPAHPPNPDPDQARRGIVDRLVANPAPVSAFLVGILVFAPGVTFLAALQVIATAQASLDMTALALLIVVIINVLLVWLPILLHLAAPGVTTRYLTAFNNWLRAHARAILCVVMAAAGVIMVANGIYGLAVHQ